jgi:hypothetical protein
MTKHVWGVMHAGALLASLGSQVEFLKADSKARTPYIRAFWDRNVPVDCEVTTVDEKPDQDGLEETLNILSGAICGDGDSHLLIHLGDAFSNRLQNNLIDAALHIRVGENVGEPGAWHVHALPLDQGDMLATRLDLPRPDWWDEDGPTLNSSGMSMGSDPNVLRRVRIVARMPFLSYFNSIERKQRTQQRDPKNPYVILVNQGGGRAIPMRHANLEQVLAGHLPLWDDVSAILLFDYRVPMTHQPFCRFRYISIMLQSSRHLVNC